MKKLKNKTIVITGASSGIGEKVARKVAEKGATPILLARSSDKLEKISKEIKEDFSVTCLYF
ncbi:SDR family NAD(P)-dependent oxidoreductase, partial [Oceanobacillus senegalensis]